MHNSMHYWGVLSFLITSLILCGFMLLCGYCLGEQSYSRSKHIPFESGVTSIGDSKIRCSIKFYLVAMVFVIFDVEGIYLYLWAISIRDVGWIGFIEIFVFVLVLLVGLIYLIRSGIFDWIRK